MTDKKYKVLHIISHPGLGGAQTLLKSIIQNTNNQYIYCLRRDNFDMFYNLQHMHYYGSYKFFKFNPFILYDLYKISKGFQILHSHLGKPLIYAAIIKILNPSVKIIYHEHGSIFGSDNFSKRNFFYEIMLKLFAHKVDEFIAISNATKRKLIDNGNIPENNIKVLYNFVDLANFNPINFKNFNNDIQRGKLGINQDDFVIGFAGRLVNRKGWMELVKSAKILFDEKIKLKFIIVGDGPDRQKLIDLINKLSLKNNVYYLGRIPDIRSFYSLLDCFIIPSHWEPMGITELEAQAMGIPVIASDVDGLNEIIHDEQNGLLFKSEDENDLAEKIKLIHSDEKLRNKLIKNGLEDIKKYSIDEYLKQLDKIYSNLC